MPACSPSRLNRTFRRVGLGSLIALAVVLGETRSASADAATEASANAYPRIELVTMGVGSLMWERHGHIALCVRWSEPRRDRCYNYGVANFHQPLSMGAAFFRGKKSFWVAASSVEDMLSIYTRADRTVWIQRLPLTLEQKRQIIEKLRFDVRRENRYYAYDHFWDNCTTRVRDVLDDAMGGALQAIDKPMGDQTIRDYARKGFFGMRWALLITDIFMGRVTDAVPSYWERMYLPQYLREAFEEEFGVKATVYYQRQGPPEKEDAPSGRFILLLIILVLTAPAWITLLLGRFERLGIAVSIFIPALLGIILWVGAIGSPVPYVRWNESALLFVPFDLLLMVPRFARASIGKRYAQIRVAGLLLASLLLAVGVLRQPILNVVLWPLIPCVVVGFGAEIKAALAARKNGNDEEE